MVAYRPNNSQDGRSAQASVQGDEIGSDAPVIPCINNGLVKFPNHGAGIG